jgi:hypothetical protein
VQGRRSSRDDRSTMKTLFIPETADEFSMGLAYGCTAEARSVSQQIAA